MADNVTLDVMTGGQVVATDDVSGYHYQKVKLVDGTADSAAMIPGDATNGLDVDVTRLPTLPAGDNNIGNVDILSIAGGDNNIGNVDVVTLPSLPAGSNNIGDVDILSIASGDNNIGNVDIVSVPADPFGANADAASASGSISAKLREIATNGVILKAGTAGIGKLTANSGVDIGDVDILSIAAGDNNIGNVDIVSLPASTNTIEVVGDVAHSTAVAGNPIQVCGSSQDCDDTAPPNRVDAEGDATRFATDRDGCQFVRPHGPQVFSYHLDTSTAQTDASVHSAPGAGLSIYVGSIVFSSGAATAINLFFEEGSTKVLGPYYLEAVAGRGFAIQFNPPKKITANTALTLTTSASIAHCVDVTGFIAQG